MPGAIEPNLKLGVICGQALIEKDNVLSLIRIVDKFTLTITGREPPNQLPKSIVVMTIVMTWIGGLGSHEAAFNIVSPGGETQNSPKTWSFNLDSLNQGHNIIAKVPIKINKAGVYWIEFILNDKVESRMPFQVVYDRQRMQV